MGRDAAHQYLIAPTPDNARLTRRVVGVDESGAPVDISVVEERPLTIFLNGQEIVTAMTIGDYPEYLALGFLKNQGMLQPGETLTGVDFDDDLETVVVRTNGTTTYEEKLKKKTRTSGCAVGTVFGDMMEGLDGLEFPETQVRTSWLYALSATINRTPSLYLEAGAIHGTVLCHQDRPLVYMEDVGRHNAVDKVVGRMLLDGVLPASGLGLFVSGRASFEMVQKAWAAGFTTVVAVSAPSALAVSAAQSAGMQLAGFARNGTLNVYATNRQPTDPSEQDVRQGEPVS